MVKFRFTGNPFVDAGIAAICAAAGIRAVDQIDEAAIDRAFEHLMRIMTSDAMFKERQTGKKKASKFATSEMTAIFPNGPLSQASYPDNDRKRAEYTKRVQAKYEALKAYLAGTTTRQEDLGVCFVDGSPAVMRVGNDEFPLVDSKSRRNFHPNLQPGHAVGAMAAFALEFFPLSVLRTGINSGLFWFVHTANEKIAIACAKLTLDNMNRAIARGDGLGFYGNWEIHTENRDAALVALIRDLMSGRNQQALQWSDIDSAAFPVTAYVFSNDNRSPSITAHDLPHQLFYFFFAMLYPDKHVFDRFNHEVLQGADNAQRVAENMLLQQPILNICRVSPKNGAPGSLRGGWGAHSLYASEVLGMDGTFIRAVEEVSGRIMEHEKARDLIVALQTQNPKTALLRLTRMGLVSFDEYSGLVPPGARGAASTARDYLLAALYERQAAEAGGRPFQAWNGEPQPVTEKHALVARVEEMGETLVGDLDLAKRLAADLAKARRTPEMRNAVLRVMRKGVLSWSDFVAIFPPNEPWKSHLVRDYLLAYLYWALRANDLPEPEPPAEHIPEPDSEAVA